MSPEAHQPGRLSLARDFAYLRDRIEGDASRPSLSSSQGFIEIMQRRDPWYRRAADWVIDCDSLSKDEITLAVLREFYQRTGTDYDPEED